MLSLLLPTTATYTPSNATMRAVFMRRAIVLAREAIAAGQQPYGALIADPASATIVAEGANHASHNPIWHGEMSAIANLSAVGTRSVYARAPSLELYTTAEPCPMCMAAIGWSGFAAVLYGTSIPFIEARGADQIDVRAAEVAAKTPFHNVSVVGGVLANETNPLYESPRGRVARHRHDDDAHDHEQSARQLGQLLSRAVAVSTATEQKHAEEQKHVVEEDAMEEEEDEDEGPPARPAAANGTTNVLVGYYSATNRTAALAKLVADGAAAAANTAVRLRAVDAISCDDLRWMHGLALGSPVYWGTMAGAVKTFIDNVQTRCFGWPVTELRWRAGAAFATGAHVAAGKVATMSAIQSFYLSVQMVVVGGDGQRDDCLIGACATDRNESAAVPQFTPSETTAATKLGGRLATAALGLRPLM